MTDTYESAYTRFNAAIDAIGIGSRGQEYLRDEAGRLCSQAVSYVWGFQDAGGEVKDTARSTEFGYAYGVVAAKYAAGRLPSRPPIQDAWRSWQSHGEIRDWSGTRLDA